MTPTNSMAAVLSGHEVDLGDERDCIAILAGENYPMHVIEAFLDPAIETARELRAGCFELDLA